MRLSVAREAMDRAVGIRSIFNPDKGFDPAQLNGDARKLFDDTKARMDATPTIYPKTFIGMVPEGAARDTEDRFLGHAAPVPGWMQVEIPRGAVRGVRAMYPESRPPFRRGRSMCS
jgi:hypothetical protein